ncbi:hypothetical protein ml_400 [Mollivirus sibericum]|uniref:hypothetical protein n=1 Tax=Mollivirus sibericum TaxID=1678078 RepID=UPI0006B2EF99|nr:hypothetical protein ml_400 [Mollivirus sibericum]ALD62202.1 hypothetical protein ml_400 [Mollivirus sibericum]
MDQRPRPSGSASNPCCVARTSPMWYLVLILACGAVIAAFYLLVRAQATAFRTNIPVYVKATVPS